MISGAPPVWHEQPNAAASKSPTPKSPSPFLKAFRWVPASLLAAVCACSSASVVLLALLPAAGVAAPLGTAFAFSVSAAERVSASAPTPSAAGASIAWCMLGVYAMLWALATASAVVTIRTPPGHIPLWLYSREPGDQAYFHNVLQAVEKKLDGSLRFCRKCGAFKPDLAHHSRELGLCILCYQHWDIWSNNAIGFYNHKAYLLCLLYGACAHGMAVALLLPGVLRAWPLSAEAQLPHFVLLAALYQGGEAAIFGFAALSVLTSAVLGAGSLLWLLFHAVLVARGTTAHGFFRQASCTRHKPPKPKVAGRPFDFGIKGNFVRACGRHPMLWLLPSNQGVEGNGIFFELRMEDSHADGRDGGWPRHK